MLKAPAGGAGWRLAALLALALAMGALLGGCGVFFGGDTTDGGGEPDAAGAARGGPDGAADAARPAPDGIAVAGNLVFPNRRAVSFDTPGVIGEVFVSVGERVAAGQPLVALESRRAAELERAAARAQASITSIESELETLRLSAPVMIAQAELDVANAVVAVQEAQYALDDLLSPSSLPVARAQAAVDQAALNADRAQEALDLLLTPKRVAVSAAEQRVAAARVELDAAQEAYDDIKSGAYPDDTLRDARNRVAFASTSLGAATRSLGDSKTSWDNTLRQARDNQELLLEQYIGLFKFWFGMQPNEDELAKHPDDVFAEWGIDLDATYDRHNPLYVSVTPTLDDPETRWNEITIWAWLNLYPEYKFVTPTCDRSYRLAKRERCVNREFEDAYNSLDDARDALLTARSNADAAAERAEDAVAAADANLADAKDDLQDLEDGPDASLVEAAEKRLALAKANVSESETDLAELTVDIDPLEAAQAEANLALAKAALVKANEDLARTRDNRLYIARARAALAAADAVLAQANLGVAATRGDIQERIRVAEANLAVERETLAAAREDIDGSVAAAPFDGVVSMVNAAADDEVGADFAVVEVTAADVIEVEGVIDAADRPFVRRGSAAAVSVDSAGGDPLPGEVVFIDDEVRTERGVVSYAVRVRAQVPPGVSIPIRLSAASAVITPTAPTAMRAVHGAAARQPSAQQ